jgi:hypothetical protein
MEESTLIPSRADMSQVKMCDTNPEAELNLKISNALFVLKKPMLSNAAS